MQCKDIKLKRKTPKKNNKIKPRIVFYDQMNEHLRKLFTNDDGEYVEATHWSVGQLKALCKKHRLFINHRKDRKKDLIERLVSKVKGRTDMSLRPQNQNPNVRNVNNQHRNVPYRQCPNNSDIHLRNRNIHHNVRQHNHRRNVRSNNPQMNVSDTHNRKRHHTESSSIFLSPRP